MERHLTWNVTRLPAGPDRPDGADGPERERHTRPGPRGPAGVLAPETGPPWAELHCHSSYSFLDGASSPAELVAEATRLGLAALAVTDHDGMYGVAQFAQAAAGTGLATVFGAELSLAGAGPGGRSAVGPRQPERAGSPDPAGRH